MTDTHHQGAYTDHNSGEEHVPQRIIKPFGDIVVPIFAALFIAIIFWNAFIAVSNAQRITNLEARITARTASRYTADDAARDLKRIDDRFRQDEVAIYSHPIVPVPVPILVPRAK